MKSTALELNALPSLQSLLGESLGSLDDATLDRMPVGVYVCDRHGRVVNYNRAAAELWGWSPNPGDPAVLFCGSYRLHSVDGRDMPHSECPMAQVLATGEARRNQEIVIERHDGTRLAALASIEPIRDEAGQLVGAVNSFRAKGKGQRHSGPRRAKGLEHEAILRAVPTAIYATDAEGRLTFFNEAAVNLWGQRPELHKQEFCGSLKLYWPDGTPLPHHECPMAIALKTGKAINGMEAVAERPDGSRVPFLAYPTPLFDESGALSGAVNMLVDISARKPAEVARQRLAALVESSEDAILTKDLNGVITSWNHAAERLFGYTAAEALGNPVTMLIPTDRLNEEAVILASIRRGERVEHYETVRQRKDGSLVDISLSISPVKTAEGTIVGASKIARDITERRKAQQQQSLLLQEMNHRVKNLLTLSGGLVALSARCAETPQELAASVQERLQALAKAHELILPQSVEAADHGPHSTTLHALVGAILSPYKDAGSDPSSCIAISGPDTAVSGRAATGLALLLHEFATNATKYGALSVPEGRVDITCSDDGDEFVVVWSERGGPPLSGNGNREGFGTLLSRATVESQLRGKITREWNPQGLRIRLSVPRAKLT